jgi:hypothetical protein
MEHTWQSNHLAKLEFSSLETGDVSVCGSLLEPAQLFSQLDEARVSFVAPLACRSDLEWLLRGLHRYPNIRHLIICGDDRNATGEALLALWQHGLEKSGRLPGPRGILSSELDATAIDALRSYVKVLDWRDKAPAEIASGIVDLPLLAAEREAQMLANPVIPERKTFLSRKTTFPIFSSDVGDSWLQLLNLALRIGTAKRASDGERLAEALNAVVTIETPVLEDGENKGSEEFQDFLDFNRDDFDRIYFPYYTERIGDRGGRNQLEAVCDRLKKSLDSRSGTAIFSEPADMAASNGASNLISATLNAIDEKLFGSFVLRSADLYTDWPLEAMALRRLQGQMAERLGLELGSATFIIHSAYLYERDWNRATQVLKESFKRPLPLHVDPSGVFLFGNDNGKARAMLLNHDASVIMWEDAFSDPEDLSWYIVDVMPWLSPQHIRYVGQECAALMRAMREKECYLQG